MPLVTARTAQEDIIGCEISQEQREKYPFLLTWGAGTEGAEVDGPEIWSVGHVTYG